MTAKAQREKYDLNGDGKVNVADVTALVNYIFTPSYKSCPDSKHPHWIDLGLPSGTLWRCCNEGASTPEGYGDYYSFDERPSSTPPLIRIIELFDHTTYEWTTVNGMGGYLFKSNTNERAIFFPAAGWYNTYGLRELETACCYWSRFNLYTSLPYCAYNLGFLYGNMGFNGLGYIGRQNGCSVRAVHVEQE